MDFLDPKKKRAHIIRLYVGYFLMAVALAIVTTILVFEARGFDLNRQTGEIIQNGLVFANAHPAQAEVFVNGQSKGRTDMRLTIPSGNYTFEFRRDGYRSWKRSFYLAGSEIERLNYAFMFPEQLNPTQVRSYTKEPGFATQSLDRKWLVVQQVGKPTVFDVMNLGESDNPVTTITLPNNLMNSQQGTLELVEWSNDNRHFIMQHTYAGGSEFILVDREQPGQSINLNRHFGVNIYRAAMRDKKFDKLHMLDKAGGTLRFADVKTKQMTPVATKTFAFKSFSDDVVAYVTSNKAAKGKVVVHVIKGDKNHTVRSLVRGSDYPMDLTRYDDEWYFAVGSTKDKKAYVYHEMFKDLEHKPARVPIPTTVFRMKQSLDNISVSANTRFIGVQGGSEFAVYDGEHNRQYQYDTKLKLAKGQLAKWMDGHRYAIVSGGKLTIWDYDGINMQTLLDAHPTFIPFFDRDYDFLYTLSPSINTTGQSAILKTPVRTPADL